MRGKGISLGTCVEIAALAAAPAVLALCAAFGIEQTALLSCLVVLASLAVFFAGFERSKLRMRDVMPTVVLAACAVAGRMLFAPFPDVKPVSAICIIAGTVFGRRSGFMVGALAALVSNFFFGQGPWTPWQMYSWGLIGYLAGVLADRGLFDKKPGKWPLSPLMYGFGLLSGILYGFILNTWYIVGFVRPLTWEFVLAGYLSGLPFDVVHSVATVAFLAILYEPWKAKLERIRRKYDLRG